MILIVVDKPEDWPIEVRGTRVISARSYLADAQFSDHSGVKVFNLCRSYRYQSVGYYVSLLAAARGHKPFPPVTAIQDMKSQTILRFASDDLEQLIQRSLQPIRSDEFQLSIYFGQNVARRYDDLSAQLFKHFQVPLLRAHFALNKKWQLQSIGPIAASEIPDEHNPFVLKAAQEFFAKPRFVAARKRSARYDLAILYNTEEDQPPSNKKAIRKFVKAAEALGLATELIDKEDYSRIAEFDALFIRETTAVNHHTFRFARRAHREGLVVIDDPDSILKCTNKVYLAEALEHHDVPTPKTVIVHRDNLEEIVPALGLPVILKRPDSSFSQGVIKVKDAGELATACADMLERSELIIAQQYLPTRFDWRVTIFDRRPLFACKYFMADDHWQIIKHNGDGKRSYGQTETVPVELAPKLVVRTALRAANLIGDGLYGVDLKQEGKQCYVIEVNDNPNIDCGIEDEVLRDALYENIMWVFLNRIERKSAEVERADRQDCPAVPAGKA